jgi:NAD(P)-dependent dehydrogenase (short-subunit alcohol dehydrogenase family)
MNPIDGPSANAQRGMMAIQQYANADQIAGLVAYLASPEAQFITGSLLTIDGGTNA